MRESLRLRMVEQSARNFPVASKSVQRSSLVTQELKTANYNELRFLSRRPFNINPKTRDERNKHSIGHPGE